MALALVRHKVQGARILGPFFLDSCLINSTAYGLVEWHRAKKGPEWHRAWAWFQLCHCYIASQLYQLRTVSIYNTHVSKNKQLQACLMYTAWILKYSQLVMYSTFHNETAFKNAHVNNNQYALIEHSHYYSNRAVRYSYYNQLMYKALKMLVIHLELLFILKLQYILYM